MGQIVDFRTTRTEAPVIAHRNYCADGTASSTGAAAGYPAAAAITYATYEGWRPSTNDNSITVTFSADRTINYIAAVYEGVECDDTIMVQAQYTVSGAGSATRVVKSGQALYFLAAPGVTLWLLDDVENVESITLVVLGGNTSSFRLATLMAGLRTELPRNIYVGATPLGYGRQTVLATNRAEDGGFLGRIVRRQSFSNSWQMANITASDYRSIIEPWARASTTQPFIMAWRPNTALANFGDNSDFAAGNTGWSLAGMEIVSDPSNSIGGLGHTNLLRTTGTGDRLAVNDYRMPVSQLDRVYITGFLKTSAGATFTSASVQLDWRDDSDAFIGFQALSIFSADTSYSLRVGTARAPDQAVTANISCRVAGLTGGTVYFQQTALFGPEQIRQLRLTECDYVWMNGDMQVSNQRPNGMMQVQFSTRAAEACDLW
jgi:hypothetical protein